MLYPTHRRLGIQFGMLFSIILLSVGLFSLFSLNSPILMIFSILILCSGSIFGSEFPDIDSPRSKPTQRHPIWKIFFNFFHIEHRGKFSHSVLSQFLFWLAIWLGSILMINNMDNSNSILVMKFILGLFLGNVFELLIGFINSVYKSKVIKDKQYFLFVQYLMTGSKEIAKELRISNKDNLFERLISYGIGVLFSFMVVPDNIHFFVKFVTIYIIGIYIGVLSHLFGDMSTISGIYIGWNKQFKPIAVLKNIPILNLMIDDGKTGGDYEERFRKIVTLINFLLFLILVLCILKKIFL